MYIEELEYKDCITVMNLRLNMVETKANYEGSYKNISCPTCYKDNDTTEHLFECEKICHKNKQISISDIEAPSKELAKHIRDILLLRKELGFEIKANPK